MTKNQCYAQYLFIYLFYYFIINKTATKYVNSSGLFLKAIDLLVVDLRNERMHLV